MRSNMKAKKKKKDSFKMFKKFFKTKLTHMMGNQGEKQRKKG